MTFRRWIPGPLSVAALLGLATMFVPTTSATAQGALDPDRKESSAVGDQEFREIVDLSVIEFTAGSRYKVESDRDGGHGRAEHKSHRDAKPDSKGAKAHRVHDSKGGHGEHHASKGHKSKRDGKHASHHRGHGKHHGKYASHHHRGHGEHHGKYASHHHRGHGEHHASHHDRGGHGEHHASKGHESKRDGEHASHHRRGPGGEHHAAKGHESKGEDEHAAKGRQSKHEGEHAAHHRGGQGKHHAAKGHESKREVEHASDHHRGPGGEHHAAKGHEPKHEGEHHAAKGHEPKHEGEHAAHHRGGPGGEYHARKGAAGEHRGPKDGKSVHHFVKGSMNEGHHPAEKPKHEGPKAKPEEKHRKAAEMAYARDAKTVKGEVALAKSDVVRAQDRLAWSTNMKRKGKVSDTVRRADEVSLRKAKFELENAQAKKGVLEKYTKEKSFKEAKSKDEAKAAKGRGDVNARVDQIEKKLDELIRIVHELKGHDAKDGKESRRK